MVLVGGSDTHPELIATASARKSRQRGRQRTRNEAGANELQAGGGTGKAD